MPSDSLSFIGISRFRGYWNASTNTALSGGLLFTGSHANGGYANGLVGEPSGSGKISVGEYWQVNTAGSTNLEGNTGWQVDDWLVYTTGSRWARIDYVDTVSSIVVGSTDIKMLSKELLASSSNTQILFNSGSTAAGTMISGSKNLTYDYQAGIMRMTGSLFVSGTLVANEYKVNVHNETIVNISSTGSTSFGDSSDDIHSFTGRVGMGLTNPDVSLHVKDTVPELRLEDAQGGRAGVQASEGNLEFYADDGATQSNTNIVFQVDNSEKLRIDTDGKVGIGSNNPTEILTVNATSNPRILIQENGSNKGTISGGGGGLYIRNLAGDIIFRNSSEADLVRFKNGGNVGIGVTDPDSLLEVYGTSTQLKLSYDATDFATFTVDTNHDLTITPSSTGQIKLQPTTDSTDFFQVLDADGGTPVLNVDSTNERVGVGTATPTSKLSVNGQTDLTGSVLPGADNTYDLGSSAHRWANIYTGDLHLKNHKGDWTIVEEEDYLEVVNNKTGKRYKMVLQEIED